MLLDVPFITNGDYPAFLGRHLGDLSSVHFSLADPRLPDARQRLQDQDLHELITGLNRLKGVFRYALMNGRLLAPDRYFDREGLAETGDLLELLSDEAGLTGVVFADLYFLQGLADARPDLGARLEAVPSINAMPDSPGRVFALLSAVERTGFRVPSRIVLDRSLNRDFERLREVSEALRRARPGLQLLLMANEGCLFQCPYKPAHDAHVALVNEGLCGERTFAMNRDLGCVRRMLHDPGAMAASPFIRPEDTDRYAGLVDGFKLCGRNRGPAFLTRAVRAYLERKHEGNLLDLMDAMGDLADRVDIPNTAFPDDFFDHITTCDKDCARCGWCATLMERISTRNDPGLGRFSP